MKYILRIHDPDELVRVQALLRAKGIPTHVVQEESSRMGAQWALFACINAQAADALQLLRDPSYVPAISIDAAEFEQATRSNDLHRLTRAATIVFCVGVPALSLMIYVLWRYF